MPMPRRLKKFLIIIIVAIPLLSLAASVISVLCLQSKTKYLRSALLNRPDVSWEGEPTPKLIRVPESQLWLAHELFPDATIINRDTDKVDEPSPNQYAPPD
jgi:hypothetical protein